MSLILPDGQPFDESDIVGGDMSIYPFAALVDGKNYSVAFDDPEDVARPWAPMSCRAPSNWAIVGSHRVLGSTLYPISKPYGPPRTEMTVTLTSEFVVSKGYEVSGEIGVNIEILEAQTGAKLKGEVTTRRGESIQFRVKVGERVYLAAQFVYEEHSIRRTVYAGPNCQPSEQSVSVLTPSTYSTLVAKYNV